MEELITNEEFINKLAQISSEYIYTHYDDSGHSMSGAGIILIIAEYEKVKQELNNEQNYTSRKNLC